MLSGPYFFVKFSAPPEISGGVLEKHLCTGRARTCNSQISYPTLYQCATDTSIHIVNFKTLNAGVSSVGPPVSGVHTLALVHDVAGIYVIAGVSSVVSPTVTSVHALVLATMTLVSVSEVVGSSVAGIVAL